jgi:tRNA dimethylallyltransferase
MVTAPNVDRLLVVIFGPTSSGKTALSIQVAQRIKRHLGRAAVVVSADSRQVYRYMDIGTSKTTLDETGGIRHEMIDVAEPVRKFQLEEYARLARRHITEAFAAGQVPIVVGGTGVYVKALLEGWDTDRVGAVRGSLRRDFPPAMAADAYAVLRRLDRTAAARVHPNNYDAVINTLAGVMAAGSGTGAGSATRADSATGVGSGTGHASEARVLLLGLDPGASSIDERVVRTYDEQVRRGLLEEIQDLDRRYRLSGRRRSTTDNQVLHTHGYREYFEVAGERGKPVSGLGTRDLAEVRTRVIEHIRGYTRHQRSWFGKLPGVRVASSPEKAYRLVAGRIRPS